MALVLDWALNARSENPAMSITSYGCFPERSDSTSVITFGASSMSFLCHETWLSEARDRRCTLPRVFSRRPVPFAILMS